MQAILTRKPTLASAAICIRLLDAWSHSIGIYGPGLVIDSTALNDGVRRRSWDEAMHGVSAALLLDIPLPDEDAGRAWALDRLGTPYDWPAIAGFAFGKPERQNPARLYCHEFVAGWCKAGGLDDFDAVRLVKAKHLVRVAARRGSVTPLVRRVHFTAL